MKVRVAFTVEIDADLWAEAYGLVTNEEIREDVKQYAEIIVNEQFRHSGVKP
jgi:hypothetical protein